MNNLSHRFRAFLPLLAILLLTIRSIVAQSLIPAPVLHGPSPEVMEYQHPAQAELYRLRFVNEDQGAISGSRDGGKNWLVLGHVLVHDEQVSNQGYTASKWSPESAVCATAVNAIHVRTGYNPTDDLAVVFSILPKEMLTDEGRKLQSFYGPDASIYTDFAGGTGIFGGHWSPLLGNPIELEQNGALTALPLNYVPKKGDIFIIRVFYPLNAPKAIIFENKFGGMITVVNWDESEKIIGQVLNPVAGVGRFFGGQYADVGRLRANHSGVIDINVSPVGGIGGFQIVPRAHAMSPQMDGTRIGNQWMVVGPLDARDPSWEGVGPLFAGYLIPNWAPEDWRASNWQRRLAADTIAQVRIDNGPWQSMPRFQLDPDMAKPLPEWANTALFHVSHFRILLPSISALRSEMD